MASLEDQENKPRKLTRKQKAFVDELLADKKKSATQAVIDAGYDIKNRGTAEVIAYENLRKPQILAYMSEKAPMAEQKILELVHSDKEEIALRASQDVLDRIHGKAVQRQEVQSVGVTLNIDLTGTSQQE